LSEIGRKEKSVKTKATYQFWKLSSVASICILAFSFSLFAEISNKVTIKDEATLLPGDASPGMVFVRGTDNSAPAECNLNTQTASQCCSGKTTCCAGPYKITNAGFVTFKADYCTNNLSTKQGQTFDGVKIDDIIVMRSPVEKNALTQFNSNIVCPTTNYSEVRNQLALRVHSSLKANNANNYIGGTADYEHDQLEKWQGISQVSVEDWGFSERLASDGHTYGARVSNSGSCSNAQFKADTQSGGYTDYPWKQGTNAGVWTLGNKVAFYQTFGGNKTQILSLPATKATCIRDKMGGFALAGLYTEMTSATSQVQKRLIMVQDSDPSRFILKEIDIASQGTLSDVESAAAFGRLEDCGFDSPRDGMAYCDFWKEGVDRGGRAGLILSEVAGQIVVSVLGSVPTSTGTALHNEKYFSYVAASVKQTKVTITPPEHIDTVGALNQAACFIIKNEGNSPAFVDEPSKPAGWTHVTNEKPAAFSAYNHCVSGSFGTTEGSCTATPSGLKILPEAIADACVYCIKKTNFKGAIFDTLTFPTVDKLGDPATKANKTANWGVTSALTWVGIVGKLIQAGFPGMVAVEDDNSIRSIVVVPAWAGAKSFSKNTNGDATVTFPRDLTATKSMKVNNAKETLCMDENDNDSDSNTDCDDSDCLKHDYCGGQETGTECADGTEANDEADNDYDSFIDCDDADCSQWCAENSCNSTDYDNSDCNRNGYCLHRDNYGAPSVCTCGIYDTSINYGSQCTEF